MRGRNLKPTIFMDLTELKHFCCFKRWNMGNLWHAKASKDKFFHGTFRKIANSEKCILSTILSSPPTFLVEYFVMVRIIQLPK